MNTTEIVEGNKIIAEFMGLKPRWVEYPNPQINRWEVDTFGNWRPMKYHSSWDWLMPVIAKINDMFKTEEMEHDYQSSAIHDFIEISLTLVNIIAAHKHTVELIK